ncbi:MAG: HAD family hydrolase, partial [Planctomycetota bacterium]
PDRRDDEPLVTRVTADYRAAYAEGWANKTRPYDGVPELLAELARRGIRLAVLSNKPQDTTEATVAAFLGAAAFEAVRGARQGVPLKPDPAAALAIAGQMGLTPAEILYVGDTATDMATASAAGMYAVGALWGFRTAEELLEAGARVLIDRPPDVLRLLS